MSASVYQSAKKLKLLIFANSWVFKKNNGKKIPPFFLTLTFRDNVTDIKYAHREFTKFIQRLDYAFFGKNGGKIIYIAVPQFQKRGAIHYHCILFNLPFVKNVYKKIRSIWGHGSFVNLKAVKSLNMLFNYIKRYMVKDFQDGRLKGKRKYFSRTKGTIRPLVIKGDEDDPIIESIIRSIKPFLHSTYTYTIPCDNPYTWDMNMTVYTLKRPFTIFDIPLDPKAKERIELYKSKYF